MPGVRPELPHLRDLFAELVLALGKGSSTKCLAKPPQHVPRLRGPEHLLPGQRHASEVRTHRQHVQLTHVLK